MQGLGAWVKCVSEQECLSGALGVERWDLAVRTSTLNYRKNELRVCPLTIY